MSAISFNTGNNLLYLITAIILSVILISIPLTMRNMSNISVDLIFPDEIYANKPFLTKCIVTSIDKFSHTAVRISWNSINFLFPFVHKKFPCKKKEVCFFKRGIYPVQLLRVSSSGPLGIFQIEKIIKVERKLIVYPEIFDVYINIIPEKSLAYGEFGKMKSSNPEDLYGIRKYVSGDDPRRIHWKASAKASSLMLKEFESGSEKNAYVVFNGIKYKEDELEKKISLAGSYCEFLIKSNFFVKFETHGKKIHYGTGKTHLLRILECLAGLEFGRLKPFSFERDDLSSVNIFVQ